MEKIYMEESKNRRRISGMTNFSVVLSFLVAIFAIFSLATYGVVSNQGMNAVSYAAPTNENIFSGGEFHFMTKDENENMFVLGRSGANPTFDVPMYTAEGNQANPVFCVEHNVSAPGNNTVLQKGDEIKDYGLLYILNNTYANGKEVTTGDARVVDGKRPLVERWITQVAIWVYLFENQGNVTRNQVVLAGAENDVKTDNVKVNLISQAELDAIVATNALVYPAANGIDYDTIYAAGAETIYTKYVEPLVTAAKNASGKALLAVIKEGDEVAKTTDGNYYQSKLIRVQANTDAVGDPSTQFQNYDVTLSGVEGAILVGEDGNELAATGIPAGKGFYVRVPADKVKDTAQRLSVDVVGHFTTLAGNYFAKAGDGEAYQKVVTVTGANRNVPAGTDIDFIGIPDTGMSTAQTIYFIGLIVLLCGVGIVYANAKPVEQKQQ